MEKVRFGKTELMVSRVALGGIPVMRVSAQEGAALVRESLRLGIRSTLLTPPTYTGTARKR